VPNRRSLVIAAGHWYTNKSVQECTCGQTFASAELMARHLFEVADSLRPIPGRVLTQEEAQREAVLTDRIREAVTCGCCPVDQDVVESIAEYFLHGLGYTDAELAYDRIDNEADLLYNYATYTKGEAEDGCLGSTST
jgi:hypothetical protein